MNLTAPLVAPLALAMALLSGPSLAGKPETAEIRTARFKIIHTARAKGAAEYLANGIEAARDDVGLLLGRDWPGLTEIRLGFDRSEYELLALPGGTPPSWAVALAYPGHNLVLVEAHSLVSDQGWATLRHELVHAALGQFGDSWPRWFQEGLAQELTGERQWRRDHLTTLANAVQQGRIFAFDELASSFPSRPEDVEIAYAQSVAFVQFLRERHGKEAFRQLIERVAEGDGFEKAFGVAFHLPLSMEEGSFRQELPALYPWWPSLLSGDTPLWWTILAMLMMLGVVRRSLSKRAHRAEQLRLETLEDTAEWLLARSALNDDAPSQPHPMGADRLWVVNVVHFHPRAQVRAVERPAQVRGT